MMQVYMEIAYTSASFFDVIINRFRFDRLLVAIYKAGKSIEVSPESRLISKHALKPSEMCTDNTDNNAHIEHGKECAYADNMPLPCSPKDITGSNAKDNKRDIYKYLNLGKLCTCYLAYRCRKAFAWHRDASATHFKGYPDAEDRATCHLHNDALQKACRGYP